MINAILALPIMGVILFVSEVIIHAIPDMFRKKEGE